MNVNIELAQQAKQDLNDARRRYDKAMVECLPVGTPIQFRGHNGKKYKGVVAEPYNGAGFIKIQNQHTGRSYWIGLYFLEGL